MKYKLLALDLDDTLLNKEFKISARNVEALRKAAEAGVLVTIATGRMFSSALVYARQLQLNVPLITYHGALIKEADTRQELWHRPVPLDTAIDIADYCRQKAYHLNLFVNDRFYVSKNNAYSFFYKQISGIEAEEVGDTATFLAQKGLPPTKMNIIAFGEAMAAVIDDIKGRYGDKVHLTQARPDFLEILNLEATKGKALDFLARKEGIKQEEVAAIGDSYNDIEMLAYAGMGVAVANAHAEVKKMARFVTLASIEDGVAHFVEKYLL